MKYSGINDLSFRSSESLWRWSRTWHSFPLKMFLLLLLHYWLVSDSDLIWNKHFTACVRFLFNFWRVFRKFQIVISTNPLLLMLPSILNEFCFLTSNTNLFNTADWGDLMSEIKNSDLYRTRPSMEDRV